MHVLPSPALNHIIMEVESIPAPQLSNADPIISGSKLYHKEDSFSSLLQLNQVENGLGDLSKGTKDCHEATKYIMSITESSRLEKNAQAQSVERQSFQDDTRQTKSIDSGKLLVKKVGHCFFAVKNDLEGLSKRPSLPGEVDPVELEDHCQTQSKSEMKPVKKFWNFTYHFQEMEKTEKFFKYARHCLSHMRKFVKKLELAITAEEEYLKLLHVGIEDKEESDSDESFSHQNDAPQVLFDYHRTKTTPPKLGKVYAELRNHFKAWSEVIQNFQSSGLEFSSTGIQNLSQLQKKFEACQFHILHLTHNLISVRLQSLSSCAVAACAKHKNDYDWSAELGSGALKRFCKLIETYNNILRKRNTFITNELLLTHATAATFEGFQTSNSHKLPSEFTVTRIVTELSGPAKDGLGALLMHIVFMIHQSTELVGEHSSNPFVDQRSFDWGKVDEIEFDEDDVIHNILEHDVPHISDTDLSNAELTGTKDFMYAQGSFIVAFLNCLASNTSLMRHKFRSKSPRSTSSQYLTEDTVSAISSDDESNSIASSSFLSQLSGTGSTMNRRRKTVLWRDSWDQEAVKSHSKSYMAALVTEGPSTSFQNQLFQLVCTDPVDAHYFILKPRVGTDLQHFMVDAFVNNMIALEMLPRDILCSTQASTQTFIINRALIHWDKKISEALAIGTNDKCGTMLIKGQHPLTKTALTYVQAIHALMAIMKRYHDREIVTREALARLETTLDSFYRWCHAKINHYLTAWSLRPLLQVCLGDLSQLTAVGLSSLPMVEKCHNYVESRRTESPATLHHATKHLESIDNIITNMQSLSGYCMQSYSKKCVHLAQLSIRETFPSAKLWRQKNLTDHSTPSSYMENTVKSILEPVCTAVCVLNPRSQLTAVPPAVSALLDVTIRHIVDNKIKFSVQGALQLQRDFEYVVDYATAREAGLCQDVTRSLPRLKAVKSAMRAAKTLQRTDVPPEPSKNKGGMGRKSSRVSAFNVAEEVDPQQDETSSLEKQLLALRFTGKGARKWLKLPCSEDAVD